MTLLVLIAVVRKQFSQLLVASYGPRKYVTDMGHNYGRDNVRKRAVRRKKMERLAVAEKKPASRSRGTKARKEKQEAK